MACKSVWSESVPPIAPQIVLVPLLASAQSNPEAEVEDALKNIPAVLEATEETVPLLANKSPFKFERVKFVVKKFVVVASVPTRL